MPTHLSPLFAAAIAILVALGPLSANAQIYRWVDAEGREHFTQSLQDVPPAERSAAKARWDEGGKRMTRSDPVAPPPAAREASADEIDITTEAASGTVEESAATGPGGRTEAEWRQRHAVRRDAVARHEQRVAKIEARSAAPGGVEYSRRARRDRSRARWERNKALRDAQREKAEALATEQAKLAREQRRLEAFLEEARRAGVPPGWLREP